MVQSIIIQDNVAVTVQECMTHNDKIHTYLLYTQCGHTLSSAGKGSVMRSYDYNEKIIMPNSGTSSSY